MTPLSNYEIEQICESAYYQAVQFFSRYDYVDNVYSFADYVGLDFKEWVYPKLTNRISISQKEILYKWENKLRAEAKSWYEENVVRRKEEENRQHEIGKQQSERERESSNKLLKESGPQKGKFSDLIERYSRETENMIKSDNLAEIELLRKEIWDETINITVKKNTSYTSVTYEYDNCLRQLEKLGDKLDLRIGELLIVQKEEEERIKAEQRAKQKAQNDVNKQKLEQIQSQWKEKQNSNSKTLTQDSETNNKMSNYQTCPQCGEEVSPVAKFCTSCGTKLLVVCKNCGTSLKPTAKFCTACGTPVNQNTKTGKTPKINKETNKGHEENNPTSSFNDSEENPDILFNFAIFDLDNNPEKALKDIEKAAEMNHIQAIKFMSSCYLNGEYVEEDEEKAEHFLKRAAELGDAESQYLLGCMIAQHCNDEPDENSPEFKEIMKWMSLASEQNHGEAQYFLGTIYASEDYSGYSVSKAKELFQKARENGNEDAVEDLKELNEQFPD